MSSNEQIEPWEAWLRGCWVGRYTDEGRVIRRIYRTEQLFLAIVSDFALPVQKEGGSPRRSKFLTVEDVYFNPPKGDPAGRYVVQIFDPFRNAEPLFEKRYSDYHDAMLQVSMRLFQLDEISRNYTDDEWDAMGKYFDYETETWVVRSS